MSAARTETKTDDNPGHSDRPHEHKWEEIAGRRDLSPAVPEKKMDRPAVATVRGTAPRSGSLEPPRNGF